MSTKTQDDKHAIRNQVIGGVITFIIISVIVAIVKPLRDLFFGLVELGLDLPSLFWRHLTSTLRIPWWLLYSVLVVLAFIVMRVLRVILPVLRLVRSTPAGRIISNIPYRSGETPRSYTQDAFLGVVWRWSYDSDNNPWPVNCFCPRCDMQLVYKLDIFGHKTTLFCDKCEFEFETFEGDVDDLKSWITREIQRRIRTGEWIRRLDNEGDGTNPAPEGHTN